MPLGRECVSRAALCVPLLVTLAACSGPGANEPAPEPTRVRWTESGKTESIGPSGATTAQDSDASQTAGTSDVSGSDPEWLTPFAPYMYTVTEGATMLYAQAVVVADCVRPFGFDYPVKPFAEVLASERTLASGTLATMFGVTDAAEAERYGYGTAPAPPLTAQESALAEDPNFTVVLFGREPGSSPGGPSEDDGGQTEISSSDPTGPPPEVDGLQVPVGGCFGEANRRLDGVQTLNMGDAARAMWVQSTEDVKSEPDYQAVVAEWRECMQQAGFEATSPLSDPAVQALVKQRVDPDVPSAEEVARALADVQCKTETNLVSRLSSVSTRFEQSVVEQNQLVLQENRTALDHRLELAVDEIEKAGGFQ